jgi:hypothetical protein
MFIAREGILGRTITAMSEFTAGRHESGLASLMTVIDATAKKRYPKLGNADRFKKFLGEEIGKQLGGIFISLKNDLKSDTGRPVGDHIGAIYHLCRCFVLHETELSSQIEFELDGSDDVRIRCEGGKVIFNEGFVNKMLHAVLYAPENAHVFTAEVIETRLRPLARGA